MPERAAMDAEDATSSFVDILLRRAAAAPARLAYTYREGDSPPETVAYGVLVEQVRRLAAGLRRRLAPQARVVVANRPGLEYVTALFACFLARLVAVPSYPPRSAQAAATLGRICASCSPGLLLADPRDVAAFADCGAPVLTLAEVCREALWDDEGPSAGDLALLQYTSGSTGSPKGVMVTHANLLANLERQRRFYDVTPESRGVIWLPPYHDMGLGSGVLQPVFAGSSITLLSPLHTMQRPLRWLQALHETRATVSGAPPFAYTACVGAIRDEELEALDLSHWDCAFVGAEPIATSVLASFAERFSACGFRRSAFRPSYGLAEATLLVAGARYDEVNAAGDGSPPARVSCGRAVDDHEIVVVDPPSLAECAEGTEGEIWVRGPSVAAGYWRDAEATEAIFSARLADGRGPYLRTGDTGVVRGGEVSILGRLKDVIIITGRKLHAEDLEATLRASGAPELERSPMAAFGVEVDGAERLVLTAELRPSVANAEGERLRALIRSRVARVHEASVFEIRFVPPGSLPRTSSGKVRRHLCARNYLETRGALAAN